MRFTRAEITARNEAKKREEGFVRLARWLVNDPECLAEFEKMVESLNKKFNCKQFKGE